jgi:hypothetical protein
VLTSCVYTKILYIILSVSISLICSFGCCLAGRLSPCCLWLALAYHGIPSANTKYKTQDKQGTRQLFYFYFSKKMLGGMSKLNPVIQKLCSKGSIWIRISLCKQIPTSLINRIVAMGGSRSVKNNCGSGSKWPKQNITSLYGSGRNL